ncbi:hypothetical protein KP509_29G011200 [Ceratopteris richardii]|nr:hypothetical protein KP509_29G011200 [Ceratopteris richardii]
MELTKKGVAIILGPQSSIVAHVVACIGEATQIPILSFGATDPNLSMDQYSYFFRTAPSDEDQMSAIATLIESFNWQDVTIIFTDDDHGADGASSLHRSLQERDIRSFNSSRIPLNPTADKLREQLLQLDSAESRVFVLHTAGGLGLKILTLAAGLDMFRSGYVWIVTDLTASALVKPNNDLKDFISYEGLLAVHRFIYPSSLYKDLLIQLQGENFSDIHNLNVLGGPDAYTIYAYDAFFAAAYAITLHLAQGNNLSFTEYYKVHDGFHAEDDFRHMKVLESGPALRSALWNTSFMGTCGLIQFDKHGDVGNVVFEFVNLVGENFSVVAYWVGGNHLITSAPHVLDNGSITINSTSENANTTSLNIVWPGGSREIPKGWVPPKSGSPLRIGVPMKAGYHEIVSQTKSADNKTIYDGFCIEVFEIAVKRLRYSVSFEYIPLFSDIMGKVNPLYDNLIDMVHSGEYDAAVGDITITAERLRLVDFTQPFIESGLVVLVKKRDNRLGNPWSFLQPFTPTMWCTILGFTVFIGIVIWILDHAENHEFQGEMKKQLFSVLWFMFSTLFTTHKEETKTILARTILILWLFVVLILNSSYTASLTAILTVEQLKPEIKGLESLIERNLVIGYQTGSFVKDYLIGLHVHPDRLKDLGSWKDYKSALDLGQSKGGVAAIVDERPYIDLFLSLDCRHYTIAGPEFTKSGWGFVSKRGSELIDDLSAEILKMSQDMELERLHDKWFNEQKCSEIEATIDEQSNRLGIRSFWALFVIMGSVGIASIILYGVHGFLNRFC